MNEPQPTLAEPAAVKACLAGPAPLPVRRDLVLALAGLGALFAAPLYELMRFALNSDLFSQILLIPFVSLYIAWSNRAELSLAAKPKRKLAVTFLGVGALAAGFYGTARLMALPLSHEDVLAATMFGFVMALAGVSFSFVEAQSFRALRFPLGFLLFMVPLPIPILKTVELLMQHGSAAVAAFLFRLAGTSVFYEQLHFQLPSIHLHVAPECSGIRSTLALVTTSVITSHFFLRSKINSAILTAAVIPLALLRNGFRIFTIGELCVQIGPHMIDSSIHHRGGPIFFALSLIPFFFLLVFLMRRERRTGTSR